ncbi:MAG: hypothetical protein ACE14S_02470 [Candidatus Bathyarchaeia archaeon]
MKQIEAFAAQFGAKIALNPEFLVERASRFYLLNLRLKEIARGDFYYAGLYLGKVKRGVFFPSFNLLQMLANAAANKVVLNQKAAWLFICGRDVFRKGIAKAHGAASKGKHTLVLNEFGECLGFGRITKDFDKAAEDDVVVRNVLDVGDFVRRER